MKPNVLRKFINETHTDVVSVLKDIRDANIPFDHLPIFLCSPTVEGKTNRAFRLDNFLQPTVLWKKWFVTGALARQWDMKTGVLMTWDRVVPIPSGLEGIGNDLMFGRCAVFKALLTIVYFDFINSLTRMYAFPTDLSGYDKPILQRNQEGFSFHIDQPIHFLYKRRKNGSMRLINSDIPDDAKDEYSQGVFLDYGQSSVSSPQEIVFEGYEKGLRIVFKVFDTPEDFFVGWEEKEGGYIHLLEKDDPTLKWKFKD